ncbi:hypothetical protein G7092_02420 [Mucilaginibacter sp. HC2]|uniref:hypothetical protein n=1 Tax=Mucilaginibacter inviolabilis TaxID=2714892 RepID=UPI00140A9CD0|nr:hypothetical protein [Mucilaginibacter inviolabilis]NHA02631.1 hypothetical protein [Mucilaginibacter inviolabilis]
MAMLSKKIQSQVTEVLKKTLTGTIEILLQDGMIKIKIPSDQLDRRIDTLLQTIQQTIDKSFPDRDNDISVLIRDTGGRYENVFKIWKP